jgi:hypothetical protein
MRTPGSFLCRGVAITSSKAHRLEYILKKAVEFLLIDLKTLLESTPDRNDKTALEPFWQQYPTA